MNVLIADKVSSETTEQLKALGLNVSVQANLSAERLPAAIGDTHILVVRSTQVTAEALAAAPQLALVVRAGAGVNTIDVAEASRRGVYVANCPGKNTAAVAELAIGLLIAADRDLVSASLALRAGKWRKKHFGAARGLKGRTLGILGYGAIGQAVAERAKGLQMRIAAWSRSLTPAAAEAEGVEFAKTPLALAQISDAVSVHLALTGETRRLVDDEFFRALRPGAIFVNTSRGEVVDTAALKRAISERGLRVGLDVFENEPSSGEGAFDDVDLAAAVTATPHIGASTDEASEAIAAEVVQIIEVFLKSGRPPGVVNLCARSPATHQLVVRHFNRVGVLASILDGLREEGVNVEEMENTIFAGANAACCTLHLDQPPSERLVTRLRSDPNILHVLSQPQLPAT
jgi:D-3-phosphoglycerate dehydrogenase